MRSFEERIAEINRRSEKIIKERKKRRNHILMTCIPVVLCVTLFAALFPGAPKADAPQENADNAILCPDNEYVNSMLPVSGIEVLGPDFSRFYTAENDILLIYDLLCSYEAYEDIPCEESTEPIQDGNQLSKDPYEDLTDVGGVPSAGVPSDDDPGFNFTSEQYTITLTVQGSTLEYILSGNTLKNVTTGQKNTLSDAEVKELKTLLGIPHSCIDGLE